MKLVLVAVGLRPAAWAHSACTDYLGRFAAPWSAELKAVAAESRTQGKTVAALQAAEARRIEAVCPKGARRVVLDEHGQRVTTVQLAQRLQAWQLDARPVALIIGGPDGLDDALKASAHETLRLSDLTLPHAMVRVLLAEALYRACSLLAGHPYHRE